MVPNQFCPQPIWSPIIWSPWTNGPQLIQSPANLVPLDKWSPANLVPLDKRSPEPIQKKSIKKCSQSDSNPGLRIRRPTLNRWATKAYLVTMVSLGSSFIRLVNEWVFRLHEAPINYNSKHSSKDEKWNQLDTGMYPQGRPVRPRSHLNFQIP